MVRSTSVALAIASVFAFSTHSQAQGASTADDVCPPGEDPCIVDDTVEVAFTADLDFGLRELRIVDGGLLDFGAGTQTIRCGKFVADTGTAVAMKMRADGPASGANGATVTIEARRSCSGDALRPCLSDADCAPDAGVCFNGTGSVELGRIDGSAGDPASLTVVAHGFVTVTERIDLDGVGSDSDGGDLDLTSNDDSIRIFGPVFLDSGSAGCIGSLFLDAAGDLVIADDIDAIGGEFCGGITAELEAGRDINLRAELDISAKIDAGFLSLDAGRDILMASGPGDSALIRANGQKFSYYGYAYGADGGEIQFDAVGRVVLGEGAKIFANGTSDSEAAGFVLFEGDSVEIDGDITSKAPSTYYYPAAAGVVRVTADGDVRFGATSELDLRASGNAYEGGTLEVTAGGHVDFDAVVRTTGSPFGADSFVRAGGDIAFGGELLNAGEGGTIEIDGCRLEIAPDARVKADDAIAFVAHERISIDAGAVVESEDATVTVRYRAAEKPPVIDGNVSPDPVLVVDAALPGCPVCGNSEIDGGESCDDGNTAAGDGCSDECQNEGCIGETPGYPGVPLCDDGMECTVDTCNDDTDTCEHVLDCEEGIACTIDACVADACEHTPDDLACDDGNVCTGDTCNASTGCESVGLTGDPCDDGDLCTVTDACAFGDCVASDPRLATSAEIKAQIRSGADDDRLLVRYRAQATALSTSPLDTGLTLQIAEPDGTVLFSAAIPGGAFDDQAGDGSKLKFRDKEGAVPGAGGLAQVAIKIRTDKNRVDVKAKLGRSDVPALTDLTAPVVAVLFGTDPSTEDCASTEGVACTLKQTSALKIKCKWERF